MLPLPDAAPGLLLLGNALLTAAVEVPLFRLCGYRGLRVCALFALVNIVSNLLLNEFLLAHAASGHYGLLVLLGEVGVVLLEYALCRYFVASGGHLLATVLLTNTGSFFCGVLLYGGL